MHFCSLSAFGNFKLEMHILTQYTRAKKGEKKWRTQNYLLHPSFCANQIPIGKETEKQSFLSRYPKLKWCIKRKKNDQHTTAKHRFNFRSIRLNARLCNVLFGPLHLRKGHERWIIGNELVGKGNQKRRENKHINQIVIKLWCFVYDSGHIFCATHFWDPKCEKRKE